MEKEKLIGLVLKAQTGDNAALDALFNEYYNDVYYFALKTLKNEDLACDITQETFLEIIKSLGSLNDPAAFLPWAKKVAYSKCTRYFKKKKDLLVEEDEDGSSLFDTVAEDKTEFIPDKALDRAEFKNIILGIVASLSEEQRSATMMYYYDEMSVKEIAEIQEVSEGTVKSRLNYARKAIKQAVEDYEKKHETKLHGIPFFPFFAWLFKGMYEGGMPLEKAVKVAESISAESGVPISLENGQNPARGKSAENTAKSAKSDSAKGAKSGLSEGATVGAKVAAASFPAGIKIAAVVLAIALILGGIIWILVSGGGGDEESGATSNEASENSINNGSQEESLGGSTEPDEDIDVVDCPHDVPAEGWKLLHPTRSQSTSLIKQAFCEECNGYKQADADREEAMILFANDLVYENGFWDSYGTFSYAEGAMYFLGGQIYAPEYTADRILNHNGDVEYSLRIYDRAEANDFYNVMDASPSDYTDKIPEYTTENLPKYVHEGWIPLYDSENDTLVLAAKYSESLDHPPVGYRGSEVIDLGSNSYAVEITDGNKVCGYVFLYTQGDRNIYYNNMIRCGSLEDYNEYKEYLYSPNLTNLYDILAAFDDIRVLKKGSMGYIMDTDDNIIHEFPLEMQDSFEIHPVVTDDEDYAITIAREDGNYSILGGASGEFSQVEGDFIGTVAQTYKGIEIIDIYTFNDGKLLFSRSMNGSVSFVNRPISITAANGTTYEEFSAVAMDDGGFVHLQATDGAFIHAGFAFLSDDVIGFTDDFAEDGSVTTTYFPVYNQGIIMPMNFAELCGYSSLSDDSLYKLYSNGSLWKEKFKLAPGYTVGDLKEFYGHVSVLDDSFQIYNDGSIYRKETLCKKLTELNQAGRIEKIYGTNGSLIVRLTSGLYVNLGVDD